MFIFSITGQAQKLQIGIIGGANASFVTKVDDLYAGAAYEINPTIDKNFGVLAKFALNEKIQLNAAYEVYYTGFELKRLYHMLNTENLPRHTFHKQYFAYNSAVLGADYKLFDKLSISANVRALFLNQKGILLSTKSYTVGNNNFGWDRWVVIYDSTDYNKFDIGIEAGVVYYFWRGLFTDIKYYRGFKVIRDLGANFEDMKMYNQVLSCSFGYLFTLKKRKKAD